MDENIFRLDGTLNEEELQKALDKASLGDLDSASAILAVHADETDRILEEYEAGSEAVINEANAQIAALEGEADELEKSGIEGTENEQAENIRNTLKGL